MKLNEMETDMNCAVCKTQIPPERVECGFNTCINCSNTKKVIGYLCYSHKTAPEIVIIPSTDTESVRRANNAFNRKR
jgi:hypothetical protein